MGLQFKPAWEAPLSELAAVFTRAFDGYIAGSVQMTPPLLSGMIAQGGVDLNLSMLACRDDEPVGFALIARQGWTSRVAVMGIVPEAQGQRVGDQLLGHLIEQSHQRGDCAMELEVFEQNTRAVRLYQKHGFRTLRRLMSYVAEDPQEYGDPELASIDSAEAARQVSMHGTPDLPWQVSGSNLIRMGTPFAAYRLGDAYAITDDPSAETVVIRMIVVATDARGQGQARRLIRALWARHPGKCWFVPALCPEDYGVFFERCGFARRELNQLQMRLDFRAAAG
jgi:ribosomal protein S18 acetylase RimI-like enzyme